jgi:hypothetical protein
MVRAESVPLPEALRSAVLAHFGLTATGAEGTNGNAAGINHSGGAVSRCCCKSLIQQERATGLEPATSSLERPPANGVSSRRRRVTARCERNAA